MEEYRALLSQLEESGTPPALEGTVTRAITRAHRKRERRWRSGLLSLGGAAAAFALAVNLSLPFAMACRGVPVLKNLAAAVALSPSLKAAVENDYVQPLGDRVTVNGVTLTLDYAIADRRQVNLFYHVEGEFAALYASPSFRSPQGEELADVSILGGMYRHEPGALRSVTLNFHGREDAPEALQFVLRVEKVAREDGGDTQSAPMDDSQEPTSGEGVVLFEIPIQLSLDPAMIVQGEVYPLEQWIDLEGQRFLLHQVEIFPSFLQLELEAHPDNTAWLKGLTFYAQDDRGRRTEAITNGITGLWDPDTPGMESFRCESSFFWDSKSLTLHLTTADWLDKEEQSVTVDLDGTVVEGTLPPGVRYVGGARGADGRVSLLFLAPQPGEYQEDRIATFQIAGSFSTLDGEEIFSGGRTTTISSASLGSRDIPVPEGEFADCYYLESCPGDRVVVELLATRRDQTLSTPVEIKLK